MGTERAVVVQAGDGHHIGNVESLARSLDTKRFKVAIVTMEPHRQGPEPHADDAGKHSFYVLEGELVFTVEGEDVTAGPGTFVLVPPGIEHTFENRTDEPARFVDVHAPAPFDRRIGY